MANLKKGDTVIVLSGKEKGKSGKILDIDREAERAIVEKLMIMKRHIKRGKSQSQPDGGVVEKNGSIHLSNLALIDPESKKATRVKMKTLENGKKVRVAVKCGAQLDQ